MENLNLAISYGFIEHLLEHGLIEFSYRKSKWTYVCVSACENSYFAVPIKTVVLKQLGMVMYCTVCWVILL